MIIIDESAPAENQVTKKETKTRSWVYLHSEKLERNNKTYFYCRYELKSGMKCDYKVETKKSNTTSIANHLKERHSLKPPKKVVQTALHQFLNMKQKHKVKTFREVYAVLVAKQYLPFSMIEEKVLQDSYVAFHNEWVKTQTQPAFVTDKTVAGDIAKMADDYIAEMKNRFQSKLSLTMDAWTGPNKMSFLGITFTYLDEDFDIQRGLLEMVKMKKKHSGKYIANLFQQALSLYGIEKNMINGVTQDNASNCGTCADALVKDGFDRAIFYNCYLHILNLACQAANRVYDPAKKSISVRRTVLRNLDDLSDVSESEDSQEEEDPDFDEDETDQYAEELEDVSNKSNAILRVSSLLI